MRIGFLSVFLVCFLAVHPVSAEDARRAEIIEIIGAQLDAFRRDDAAAAFALASPSIQAMFGSPETFLRMVITSYAPVYRPRTTTYLDLVEQGGALVQRVLLTGRDGGQVLALYTMVRQTDGNWRISGCVLVQATGQAA